MKTLTTDQRIALRNLVSMRHAARRLLLEMLANRATVKSLQDAHAHAIRVGDTKAEALARIDLAEAKEAEIETDFQIIETGLTFIRSCSHYDRLPRDVWLRALSVNECEWGTPEMLKYGDGVRNVVSVLHLENSATDSGEDYKIEHKPLLWCCTMAMMNATRTDPAVSEAMHNIINEVFDGAFGEWTPPTMLEQIGVRA